MTIATSSWLDFGPLPSAQSLRALDALNFFVAGILAGFGPFVALVLGDQNWSQEEIGFVLSTGALAALLVQLPGGELLDLAKSKRFLVALGTILIGVSALVIALWPRFAPVAAALVLQGLRAAFSGRPSPQ
jgi:MFS family permease